MSNRPRYDEERLRQVLEDAVRLVQGQIRQILDLSPHDLEPDTVEWRKQTFARINQTLDELKPQIEQDKARFRRIAEEEGTEGLLRATRRAEEEGSFPDDWPRSSAGSWIGWRVESLQRRSWIG